MRHSTRFGTLFLTILCAPVFAQEIKEGVIEYSGGTSGGVATSDWDYTISNGTVETHSSKDKGLSFTTNYYLMRNFALGLGVSYTSTREHTKVTQNGLTQKDLTTEYSDYSLGPTLVLHHPLTLGMNLVTFGQVSIGKSLYKRTGSADLLASSNSISGGVGLNFFPIDVISIHTIISYVSRTSDGQYEQGPSYRSNYGRLNFGFGFSLYI